MISKIKKALTVISIASLLFLRAAPVLAFEIPSAPTPPPAPTAPAEPTPPPAPTAPTLEESAPTPPPAPAHEEAAAGEDAHSDRADESPNTSTEAESGTQLPSAPTGTGSTGESALPVSQGEQTGGESADGQTGSAVIDTGDATNNAGISTIANTNASAGVAGSGAGSVSVINSDNGSDSLNNGSVGIINDNNSFQDNSAVVTSNLNQTTETGDNSASKNTGDSKITTGDANTSGTIITAVNTNIEGVGVAEFSVMDDQVGDVILDFAAGCIYGCGGGNLTAQNTGNGRNSTNDSSIDVTTNNLTAQTNDAVVESNLNLSSDSGGNTADKNTGGSSEIITGDANVAGNALTLANNNLSGGAFLNFVYIYGDLIGDIIMPEEYSASAPCANCGSDILVANKNNGSDSTNTASVDRTTNNNTSQFNDANIENNLFLDATTGDNETNKNTGGNSGINSGNTNVDAQVLNVANSNVTGGDWWLVLINEAGNWVGQILGAPQGSGTFAGSDGTQFSVDDNGIITAVNSGNGTGSVNNSDISTTTNNATAQNNTAKIINNMDLSANTGGNSASKNTGGSSQITTGDANIIASIVNMVNNNISGGRLFVTVVDVFGSWVGNFRAPGYKPEITAEVSDQSGSDNQPEFKGNAGGGTGGTDNQNNKNPGSSTPGSTTGPTPSGNNTVSAIFQGAASVRVAGLQIENTLGSAVTNQLSRANAGRKTIKINLAWLLLGIPVLLLGTTAYRKFRVFLRK